MHSKCTFCRHSCVIMKSHSSFECTNCLLEAGLKCPNSINRKDTLSNAGPLRQFITSCSNINNLLRPVALELIPNGVVSKLLMTLFSHLLPSSTLDSPIDHVQYPFWIEFLMYPTCSLCLRFCGNLGARKFLIGRSSNLGYNVVHKRWKAFRSVQRPLVFFPLVLTESHLVAKKG